MEHHMQAEDRARVRADLMEALDWPVTSGEVEAAAELSVTEEWSADVVTAARRLPDEGHYLDIDELWADLDPAIKDVVHS